MKQTVSLDGEYPYQFLSNGIWLPYFTSAIAVNSVSYKGFYNISPLISMSTIAYLQSCWNVAAYAIQMKSSLYLLFVGGFGKDLGY